MPSPRNERVASSRIAVENESVAWTITGAAMFGSTWRPSRRGRPAPRARALSTNGACATASVGAADDPGEDRRVDEADRQHRGPERGAHDARDGDDEEHARKREDHVDQPARQAVHQAHIVARQEAQGAAEGEGQADRHAAHLERDPRPVDDAAQHVPAELVRPEEIPAPGRAGVAAPAGSRDRTGPPGARREPGRRTRRRGRGRPGRATRPARVYSYRMRGSSHA